MVRVVCIVFGAGELRRDRELLEILVTFRRVALSRGQTAFGTGRTLRRGPAAHQRHRRAPVYKLNTARALNYTYSTLRIEFAQNIHSTAHFIAIHLPHHVRTCILQVVPHSARCAPSKTIFRPYRRCAAIPSTRRCKSRSIF